VRAGHGERFAASTEPEREQMHRRRPRLAGLVASLVALALVPLAPAAVAADSDFATSCSTRLRAAPSMTANTLITMPTDTIVTVVDTVAGDAWSTTCVTAVAGSTWYAITAVNGTSVASLYGVAVAYAASGLFRPATLPPPPPAAYLEGIDVSRYQNTISWGPVAAAGKRFAIMRATLGNTYLDPTYATNRTGAWAAGLRVAAYHYAKPSTAPGDATLEADWFVQNAAPLPGDLLPALDIEETGGLSVAALQVWVGEFLARVTERLGVRPMIYASPNFWKNSLGNTTLFADQGYSVYWVAHWGVSSPSVPALNWGGRGWTFWQYTNCGSVPGISGCVDLDRFNGADLSAVTLGAVAPPPPTEPVNPAPTLSLIAPATAAAGSGDVAISIQGTGFAPGTSTAYWNAQPLATAYISPTQLQALVPAALLTATGTAMVIVYNGAPGGGSSAPAAFTIVPPAVEPAAVVLPRLEIGARSALGLRPPAGYTTTTPKTARKGTWVTWRFTGGKAMAGQRVNVLMATRVNGTWSKARTVTTRWADANGTVVFSWKSGSTTMVYARVQWPGNASYGVSTSRALAVAWR
jgi:GH25 family lysozyme M1 (1,4-beta-N-acetylmuramidase)